MKISEVNTELKSSNLNNELMVSLNEAKKDPDFVALLNREKIIDEVAMKYTSKLEDTVKQLRNCKNCKGIDNCTNRVRGCVLYPNLNGNNLLFDDKACKYLQDELKFSNYKITIFNEPYNIRTASFDNIDKTDKKRVALIKWILEYYKDYKNGNKRKGLYLHGSFGSGKSYLISALLNELGAIGAKVVIAYYPEVIRDLTSFPRDFEEKMNTLKYSDVVLLDDIGAENVTSWSRDEILAPILQTRMDANLPTFFTSNLNIAELTNHLSETKDKVDKLKGGRLIERIKQLTEDMELISENKRK
jgi:primosomal protein DnaI